MVRGGAVVACGGAAVVVVVQASVLSVVVPSPEMSFKRRMPQAIPKNVVNITAKGMKTVDPVISLTNLLLASTVKLM